MRRIHRWLRAAGAGVVYAVALFVATRVWMWAFGFDHPILSVWNIAIQGVFFGWFFDWYGKKIRDEYKIQVSEDEMTVVSRVLFRDVRRTVRRGQVRLITERRNQLVGFRGVIVSERDRLGTLIWGGVWIPRTLPEYQRLKTLAKQWRVGSRAG